MPKEETDMAEIRSLYCRHCGAKPGSTDHFDKNGICFYRIENSLPDIIEGYDEKDLQDSDIGFVSILAEC